MQDMKIAGLRVSRIQGHVRRTSNYQVDHIGQVYGEVRFSDGTKLKNMIADGIMEGFIQANDDVTFYVGWLGKNPILMAVRDTAGVVQEMDTTSITKVKNGLIAQAIQPLFLGILTALLGIGLLFIGLAIHLFLRARTLGKLIRISEEMAAGQHIGAAECKGITTQPIAMAA